MRPACRAAFFVSAVIVVIGAPRLTALAELNWGMLQLQPVLIAGSHRTAASAELHLRRARALGESRASRGLLALSLVTKTRVPEEYRFQGDEDLLLRYGVADLYDARPRPVARVCEAQRCLEQVIAWRPNWSTAEFYLARTLQEQGQAEAAERLFEASRRHGSFSSAVRTGHVGWYGPDDPTPLNALVYQTATALEGSRLEVAESLARRILTEAPQNGFGPWLLGSVFLKAGRPRDAIPVLEDGVRLLGTWKVYLALGRAYAANADHQRAIKAYEQSLAMFPHGAVLTELAEQYVADGRARARAVPLLTRHISQLQRRCFAADAWESAARTLLAVPAPRVACEALDELLRFCPTAVAGAELRRNRCDAQ